MSIPGGAFRWAVASALAMCTCGAFTEPDYTQHKAGCRFPTDVALAPTSGAFLRELLYMAQQRAAAIQAEISADPGNSTVLNSDLTAAQADIATLRAAAKR